MSKEEAIGMLKMFREVVGTNYGTDFRKAVDIAIKSLEDQTYVEGHCE